MNISKAEGAKPEQHEMRTGLTIKTAAAAAVFLGSIAQALAGGAFGTYPQGTQFEDAAGAPLVNGWLGLRWKTGKSVGRLDGDGRLIDAMRAPVSAQPWLSRDGRVFTRTPPR